MRRLSLRARLILGVIALAGTGLVAADVATYSSLQSFLVGRTDDSLDSAHQAVEGVLFHPSGPGHGSRPPRDESDDNPPPQIGPAANAARGDYVEVRKLDGTVVAKKLTSQFRGSAEDPPPRLPTSISLPAAPSGLDRVTYFTAAATSGGGRYRVRASIEPLAPQYVLIVATSLAGVDGTLHRLLLIELFVTGLVLAGLAILGLWVVRLGLKPLSAIGATAAKIADGDLSQRVARAEEGTEVGRLGLALNAMLGQIESAVKARDVSLRALEQSERKLRRFVADASHELRTPLAAVRAYAELFGRGAAARPDDLERSMRGITREAERMSLLVEDLLLLAHLDEGRPLTRATVAVDELLAEAVETARTVEPGRSLTLDAEPAAVSGDRDRLRQAVDNLLANARAHTPHEAAVRVSLRRVDGNAEISVADDGPGMAPEQAAHVFERFYRTDAARTRASGGVGLGLSIVAAVAEAHGGQARVESAPGRGSVFRIVLPLGGTATPLEPGPRAR